MNQEFKLKYLKAKENYLCLKNQQGSSNPPMLALQDRETRDKRVFRQEFEKNIRQKERRAVLEAQQLYQARERMKKEEKEREKLLLQYKQDLEQTPLLKLNYDTISEILKNLEAIDILNFYFSFDITNKEYKVLIQKYILEFIENYFKLPHININALDEYLRMVYSFYNGNKNYLNKLKHRYYNNEIRLEEFYSIVTQEEALLGDVLEIDILNYFNNPKDEFLRDNLLRNELIDVLYDEILKIINDLKEFISFKEMDDYEDYHERLHFESLGYGMRTEEEIRRERGDPRGRRGLPRRRSFDDDYDL